MKSVQLKSRFESRAQLIPCLILCQVVITAPEREKQRQETAAFVLVVPPAAFS
jgi:hypothetical protein